MEGKKTADVIDHFIGSTENLSEMAWRLNTVCQMFHPIANSLTDLDEDLPENLQSFDSTFQEI